VANDGTKYAARAASRLTERLPEALSGLAGLATNLWWSWQPGGPGLFRDLDADGWAECNERPFELLQKVAPERLEQAAADGGYLEPVHRIVDTIRHHYGHVGFIIPNHAFSAGTVLAMSGDDIYMDYYSRLGPIDPQVQSARGRPVPALGYLVQWERLLAKAKTGELTEPEVLLMIQGFDQAELYAYE